MCCKFFIPHERQAAVRHMFLQSDPGPDTRLSPFTKQSLVLKTPRESKAFENIEVIVTFIFTFSHHVYKP